MFLTLVETATFPFLLPITPRFSRRLRGLSPFTMSSPTTPAPGSPVPVAVPRPPVGRHVKMRSFRGRSSDNGVEWLKDYKHFCQCYTSDTTFHLANVKYFFKDNASIWWRNQEDSVSSFDQFCELFLQVYGNLSKSRRLAASTLSNRPQRVGESCFAYVQAILQLCRQADPTMSEVDKVNHILRGIAKSVFWVLALKKVASISELLTTVQELDTLLANRLDSSTLDQLENVLDVPSFTSSPSDASSETSDSDDSDMPTPPRRIRHRRRKPVIQPSSTSLRDTVVEVVKEVLAAQQSSPLGTPGPSSPAIAAVGSRSSAHRRSCSPAMSSSFSRRRLCWICHSPQHIQRFCPLRMQHFYPPGAYPPSFNAYPPSFNAYPPSFNASPTAPWYGTQFPPMSSSSGGTRYPSSQGLPGRSRSRSPGPISSLRGVSRPGRSASPHPNAYRFSAPASENHQ